MVRNTVVVTCALLLVSCNGDTVSPPAEREWQTTFAGTGAFADLMVESTVQFTEGTSQFTATAQIAGDELGAVRPWHVHFNTCAEGGTIVGSDPDYPRLNVGTDGTAAAMATVPAVLDAGANYHVNVHLSVAEMETVIACGDLELTN